MPLFLELDFNKIELQVELDISMHMLPLKYFLRI